MPRLKPLAFTGFAELATMIARLTPSIIELLADGVPRTKAAIVEALAGRHAEDDVALALVRLAVTGQVRETGGKYAGGGRAVAARVQRAGAVAPTRVPAARP